MTELITDDNEDNQDRDFTTRFGPDSALPTSLHSISYAKDIWRRIKNHPIPIPSIKRDELSQNAETRELIHSIFAAAESREKEILLHNQARVFAEVLNRVVSSVGRFLDKPVIDIRPKERTQVLTAEQLADEENHGTGGANPTPSTNGLFSKQTGSVILQWALTPKYILLAVVTLLGLTTGYTQYQKQQLKATITDLQAGNDIADKLKGSLLELKENYEKRASEYAVELQKVNSSKLSLEEQVRTLEQENTKISTELTQVKKRFEDEKITETEVQKKADNAIKDLATNKERVKQLELQLEKSEKAKKDSIAAVKEMRRLIGEFEGRSVTLASDNANLLKYRNGFSVVKTTLQTIEAEANRYYPNVGNIKNALNLNNETLNRIMQ